MFSHITVGTNDMNAARRFYDALFAAMDARAGVLDEKDGCCTSAMGGCSV